MTKHEAEQRTRFTDAIARASKLDRHDVLRVREPYIETFAEALGPRLVRRILHRARKLGMSRHDLCDTAELSKQHLCNLLAGRRKLTLVMADKLMGVVDLSMGEYQTGIDRPIYRGGYLPQKFKRESKRASSRIAALHKRMSQAAAPPPVYGRLV
jgi:antitoxin component HigA of HigAB toxin-antitoxin module